MSETRPAIIEDGRLSGAEPPMVESGRGFSPVWIIPILALLIGAWMVLYALWSRGPEITIRFDTAEGLEAGTTRVKMRNVDIGLVEDVVLSDDMQHIIAVVKLEKPATPLLREDSRFWVVRARVGLGNITGINTLLSGAYVQLEPGSGPPGSREFVGLEEPPLTPAGAPGVRLVLTSVRARSVSAGDAVLYNGYNVGRVESVSFDQQHREVRYSVFIDAPYDDLVTTSTRFWNASGVSVKLTAGGLEVATGSVDTLLLGGVAFDTPEGLQPGEAVSPMSQFRLYDSYDQIEEDPFEHSKQYLVKFQQSLRGLEPGAPVEYRGIQVGRVERILVREMAMASAGGTASEIPVLIYLEPGRLEIGDTAEAVKQLDAAIRAGVANGLRASLETGSLITGKQYVALDYYPEADPAAMAEFNGYPVVPTVGSALVRIESLVTRLLVKLNDLPLEDTVASTNNAIASLQTTLGTANSALESLQDILQAEGSTGLPAQLAHTLEELRRALAALDPQSPLYQSLESSLRKLDGTLQNLERITGTLENKPNALVLPVRPRPDPEPEARRQ